MNRTSHSPRATALALLLSAGPVLAQSSGTAAYIIDVADPVLAPGESTTLRVLVAFEPGIGQIIGSGPGAGPVLGLSDGGFAASGLASAGVIASLSGGMLDPPYNFPLHGPGGWINGLNIVGVLWGIGFLLTPSHPSPFNPDVVWSATLTISPQSSAGTITFTPGMMGMTGVFYGGPLPSVALYSAAPPVSTHVTVVTCYPDCDFTSALTVADFACFQTAFIAGQPYADCDGNTQLTIADFACFQNAFVAGCP